MMTNVGKSLTIAQYTLIGAYRSRALILLLLSIIACWLTAEFAAALSLTESHEMRVSIYAFLVRLVSVVIASLTVINTIQSEIEARQLNLFISLDLPRSAYILGKVFGFIVMALIVSLMSSLPLLLFTDMAMALAWTVSLLLELCVILTFSLFIISALQNNTASFIIVLAFYILSRSMANILLLSQSPVLETGGYGNQMVGWILKGIYMIIPDLWNYTRTAWLLYGDVTVTDLGNIIFQTIIFATLLAAAAIFDFYRKNI